MSEVVTEHRPIPRLSELQLNKLGVEASSGLRAERLEAVPGRACQNPLRAGPGGAWRVLKPPPPSHVGRFPPRSENRWFSDLEENLKGNHSNL